MQKFTTRTKALAVGAALMIAVAAGTTAVVTAGSDEHNQPIPVEPDGGIGDTPIPVEPDGGIGDTPIDDSSDAQWIENARALLGLVADDLPSTVRIGRSGDQQFALTADYVLGRMTVELDHVGGSVVVTSVTVELTAGPQTVTSDAR
jgi:hypothetical protein